MATQTINGTLNVTVRVNAPVVGTTGGDLVLQPAGPNVALAAGKVLKADQFTSASAATDLSLTATGAGVAVAAGKALKADQLTTTSAATDLTLNATGANINCSGKNLVNVGGLTTPNLQAVAAGPLATGDATPTALLTLAIPANTSYMVESSVSAVSPTGGPAVNAAGFVDVMRVTNRGGVLTVYAVSSTVTADAGLSAASVAYAASGANLVGTVTGVAGLGVRWAALASYVGAAA